MLQLKLLKSVGFTKMLKFVYNRSICQCGRVAYEIAPCCLVLSFVWRVVICHDLYCSKQTKWTTINKDKKTGNKDIVLSIFPELFIAIYLKVCNGKNTDSTFSRKCHVSVSTIVPKIDTKSNL